MKGRGHLRDFGIFGTVIMLQRILQKYGVKSTGFNLERGRAQSWAILDTVMTISVS